MQSENDESAGGGRQITRWLTARAEGDEAWERAYVRFETPEQETRKFVRRLRLLGAERWPRDVRITELFCGRGNGMKALEQMGFASIEGVDISELLLQQYDGPAHLYLGDCRSLGFGDGSKDVIVIHGGLHHLHEFPSDLEQVLKEAWRVLRPGGQLALVEPWLTPFLRFVHVLCAMKPVCKLWPRLGALGEMIDGEGETYRRWLERPAMVLSVLEEYFTAKMCRCSFGKLVFLGERRTRRP